MEDWQIISSLIGMFGIYITGIIALYRYFDSKYDKKIDKIKDDINEIKSQGARYEVRINSIKESLDRFESEFRSQIVDFYRMVGNIKKYTGNPISSEEKQRLLIKYKNGTITREEAEKLKRILEIEKREAEEAGNALAALAIALLLAGLGYLLYKILKGE